MLSCNLFADGLEAQPWIRDAGQLAAAIEDHDAAATLHAGAHDRGAVPSPTDATGWPPPRAANSAAVYEGEPAELARRGA